MRLAMVPEAKKLIPTDPPFRSVSSFTTRLGSLAPLTKTLTFGFWTTIFTINAEGREYERKAREKPDKHEIKARLPDGI